MKTFQRQVFHPDLEHKAFKKSPVTTLPAFMVGKIQGNIFGLEQLLIDLNNARFGWDTDINMDHMWDFVMIRNIDQSNPTVDIYAIPRINDRFYGYYEISNTNLKDVTNRWYNSQGAISTYIEGWLAGRSHNK